MSQFYFYCKQKVYNNMTRNPGIQHEWYHSKKVCNLYIKALLLQSTILIY